MDDKKLAALSSAIFVSRCTLNGEAVDTDDKRLRASGLYWECFLEYDNATYPDIRPGQAAWYTFNRPLHGTTPETARPFVPVQGAHDMYHAGEYMVWTDGTIQRCKEDTNFSPEDYPQAWETWEPEEDAQGGTGNE